jgi:hypothetical protein
MKVIFTIEVEADPRWDETDRLDEQSRKVCLEINEMFDENFGIEIDSKFEIRE